MRQLLLSVAVFGAAVTLALYFPEQKPQTSLNQKTATGARLALEFLSSARVYPNADIPKAGVAPAFERFTLQRNQKRFRKGGTQLDSWKAIGPHNIGGRTLMLALNPQNINTLYAGSASGGLWRSYSGGKGANAWHQVPTGFPVLGVSSIAIAPTDSNVIYIGTGEMYGNPDSFPGILGERLNRGSHGIGILKSIDAGRTWTKSLDWLYNQRRGVQMVRINPLRPETVWASTTLGTYRSYDAGASWEQVHSVVMGTDLVINNQDTSVVIAAYGGMDSAGKGVYRSDDSGATWVKASIPGDTQFRGKIRLAISESQPDIVFASIGWNNGSIFNRTDGSTLARSENAGQSWTVVSNQDYSRLQGWYSHDVAVHPENPNIVWTAGQIGQFYSSNGGLNLSSAQSFGLLNTHSETLESGLPTNHADFHHILFSRQNPDVIYFANDGGIFLSEDGGLTLRNCNRGYQTTQFYNGTSTAQTDSLFSIGGLQDNGSVAYEGELFWRRIGGGDGSWTAINQNNPNTIYFSWQFLNLITSNDRSRFHQQNITPVLNAQQTNFITPYILSPADNATLYAGADIVQKRTADLNAVWRFTNGGQPVGSTPPVAMAGSYQEVNTVYLTTSPAAHCADEENCTARGGVYKTTDGGNTWQEITQDLPDRFYTDIVVDPNNDDRVFVTLGGFASSHLFVSENSGESWQDIGSGLPDVPTWSVISDPEYPQQLFVGNDLGVCYSRDSGATWEPYMQGLGDAVVAMDLTISWSSRALRLATHGNGFYESKLPDPQSTGVAEQHQVPDDFILEQNYPNPFNPETNIRFFMETSEAAELSIFNTNGQRIRKLVSGNLEAGWHDEIWDGRDDSGVQVASGAYVYRLKVGGRVGAKKMTLLK